MNKAACPCSNKEKTPYNSPYGADAAGGYRKQTCGSNFGQATGPPQGQSTGYSYAPAPGKCASPYSPTGHDQGAAPQRRPPCGPEPCGRQTCPKSANSAKSANPIPISSNPKDARPPNKDTRPPNSRNDGDGPKGFEMNNATWSLCWAVALFCCGVFLTKKMAIVASELG